MSLNALARSVGGFGGGFRELGAALFAGLVVGFTVLTAQVLILGVSLTLDEAASSARAAVFQVHPLLNGRSAPSKGRHINSNAI